MIYKGVCEVRLQEKLNIHDNLNPKIWDKNNKLREDVYEKLKEIAQYFIETLEIPIDVIDAHIVGSNASYNYSEFSDLDLHLIANFEMSNVPKELLQAYCNGARASFNKSHDISIHGVNVELYVEDVKSTTLSNGIYSLYENRWIKFPQKLTNVPEIDVSKESSKWVSKINKILDNNDYYTIKNAINQLYMIRKNSLSIDGEYGKGNQIFKEIRNIGLLDELKSTLTKSKSKLLSLESYRKTKIEEATRTNLISKSKASVKGNQRYKRRNKSKVANSVKQFNSIDMNKLFKDNILTVNVSVNGETDDYTVRISFGGFLDILHDELKKTDNKLDLRVITRALLTGFNRDDVYIWCSCEDFRYRFQYWATRNDINSGEPQYDNGKWIRNPDDKLGSACKHVLLVLSNNTWLLKVASVINNYIKYMEKHYQKAYADIIYPAIYGKKYEDDVQLGFDDSDELASETDTDVIDVANEYNKKRTQFQKGNQQGVQFAGKNEVDDEQITIEDEV